MTMSDDLVERLLYRLARLTTQRDEWQREFRYSIATISDRDAEIEALTAQRDLEAASAERNMAALVVEQEARTRLEVALRFIADGDVYDDDGERIVIPLTASQAQAVARTALGGSA
jgi:hypothetical protein